MSLSPLRAAIEAALSAHPELRLLGEAVELSPATRGLRAQHPERVLLLPASDAGLVGLAVGLALGGARPVVELAGVSSLWGAAQQLGQEAAGLGGEFSAPVVLRAPLHPGEEAPWALLLGLGVAVAVAREAGEAALLLDEALQMRRPALIIEASAAGAAASPVAAGQPRLLREGAAAVVLASGEAVQAALDAAAALSAEGHEVAVVDLRWLSPHDPTRLAALAGDSGRVVLAGGAGAIEVAVLHAAFLRLESPPLRAPAQAAAIAAALRRSISY